MEYSNALTTADLFDCKLCGQCCKGFGGTYVDAQDIRKISDYIRTDPDKFIADYCDMSGTRQVLTLADNGCCTFFDPEKQCTIHPVKPYMCRAWPFIKTLINNPENWDIMANSCPGMKKGIPHKDISRIATKEKEKLDQLFNR